MTIVLVVEKRVEQEIQKSNAVNHENERVKKRIIVEMIIFTIKQETQKVQHVDNLDN